MRTLALRAAIVMVIAIVALALWQMHEAIQLLAIALTVAAGLAPLVDRLSARGLPRGPAAAIIFLGGIALLAGGFVAMGSLAANDLARIIDTLPLWYNRLRQSLAAGGSWLAQLEQALPSSLLATGGPGDNDAIGQFMLGVLSSVGIGVALTLSVASLGFYWLADQQRIERLWFSLMPLAARTKVRAVWGEIYREVGVYVRGEAVIVVLTTAALLLIFTLLDVPGGSILAIVGGVAQVVPLLGPALAVVPPTLAALLQGEFTAALVLAGTLTVVLVVRLLVAPRLFRNSINTNPVLVIVLIMALFEVGGIWLVLLAPPLAAALQASTRVITGDQRAQRTQEILAGADQVGALEARLSAIAATIDPERPDAPRLQGLAERARRLIVDAKAL